MNIKEGARVLTIAESFKKDYKTSVLIGLVYRLDGIIDGIKIGYNTVGGKNSTENILKMIDSMEREDINYLLLSGAIISWFNIIDINELYWKTGIPVIIATYEESEGLIPYLIKYFRDWEDRVLTYLSLGGRMPVKLSTGYKIYIRSLGMDTSEAAKLIDKLTLHGRYPEPIRIAKMIANAVLNECILRGVKGLSDIR